MQLDQPEEQEKHRARDVRQRGSVGAGPGHHDSERAAEDAKDGQGHGRSFHG
jgi:hypothetical protein